MGYELAGRRAGSSKHGRSRSCLNRHPQSCNKSRRGRFCWRPRSMPDPRSMHSMQARAASIISDGVYHSLLPELLETCTFLSRFRVPCSANSVIVGGSKLSMRILDLMLRVYWQAAAPASADALITPLHERLLFSRSGGCPPDRRSEGLRHAHSQSAGAVHRLGEGL